MKIIKKYKLTILASIGIILLGYFIYNNRKIYGNDYESIRKSIHKQGYNDNFDVVIAGIKDIKDSRIVGFFTAGNPGVAVFEKNKRGNYELQSSKLETNEIGPGSASSFVIHYGTPMKRAYIVVSNGCEIIKTELVLNDKYKYTETMPLNEASMVLFDVNIKDVTNINFKAFDSEGNLVEL